MKIFNCFNCWSSSSHSSPSSLSDVVSPVNQLKKILKRKYYLTNDSDTELIRFYNELSKYLHDSNSVKNTWNCVEIRSAEMLVYSIKKTTIDLGGQSFFSGIIVSSVGKKVDRNTDKPFFGYGKLLGLNDGDQGKKYVYLYPLWLEGQTNDILYTLGQFQPKPRIVPIAEATFIG